MTTFPGDPLTPGVGATTNAKRLTRAEAPTLLHIPTLPISYADASKIMVGLQGPVVSGSARGGLALAYHWGGTDAVRVHLAVKSDWSLKPIYDVIARLPGAVYPDQWIIRGNHRDGWVFGASDPLSGQVALMNEAKAALALSTGRVGARSDDRLTRAGTARSRPAGVRPNGPKPMPTSSRSKARVHQYRQQQL